MQDWDGEADEWKELWTGDVTGPSARILVSHVAVRTTVLMRAADVSPSFVLLQIHMLQKVGFFWRTHCSHLNSPLEQKYAMYLFCGAFSMYYFALGMHAESTFDFLTSCKFIQET